MASKLSGLTQSEFQAVINKRRDARMARVDELPADIRALVHEYGLSVVDACMSCGLKKARHIRHVVETVLDEFSPTRGAKSSQGAPGSLCTDKSKEAA